MQATVDGGNVKESIDEDQFSHIWLLLQVSPITTTMVTDYC